MRIKGIPGAEIKNLIFDMGNVLLRFEPETFIDREEITDPEVRNLLLQNIYRSKDWPRLDSGEWNEEDLEAAVFARIPEELHEVAHRLIFDWCDPIIPVVGMDKLLRRCKENGFGLYLLSNASRRQRVYWESIPGSEYFDGTVISADLEVMKPNREIYLETLRKYDLKAEESIFIDDVQANVEGALQAGIYGYQFNGCTRDLEEYLFGGN